MLAGTAKTTNKRYASQQRCYIDFCNDNTVAPVPATEEALLRYVMYLHSSGRKTGTINGHMSAVRHFHLINGFSDPLINTPRLTLVKRGLAKLAPPVELRAAVTNIHIGVFFEHLVLTNYDDALFYAMCCLGFFGFMRISELTHPDSGFNPAECLTSLDISWQAEKILVLLRQSKSDIRRDGVTISIGSNSTPVCAVKALQHYLNLRQALFPNLCAKSSPLFVGGDGLPVVKAAFSLRLASLAAEVGVEGKVTPHSLRIGAATAAWRAGFTDSQIQSMGRWKSRAFMRYIRIDSDTMSALNATLGNQLLSV